MKTELLLSLLLIFSVNMQAQVYPKADYVWVMGEGDNPPEYGGDNRVRADFNSGTCVFTADTLAFKIHTTYAGICDSAGQLLLYTNGFALANREHQIVENGDTLMIDAQAFAAFGLPELPAGALILPNPLNNGIYYLFHEEIQLGYNWVAHGLDYRPQRIYLTTIDMNANGGLGKVISANNILAEGDIDFPVLIKHGNGRDWWLLAGDYLNKTYQTFFIDPGGVHPVIEQDAPEAFLGTSGYHEASPDGRYYVNNDDYGLWVYDFDRCTGLLSNPRVLPYQPPIFYTSSIAFSQDSRFLYLGTHLAIYQMDMTTLDSPFISIDTIAYFDRGFSPWPPFYTQFLTPELAPDGKIYYNTFSSTQAYHVVNRPGLPLDASDLAQRGQIIPRWRNGTWCYFPNYRLGRWSGSPCDTLSFKSPSDAEFQHIPWSESGARQEGTATVKTLQWPPWITIPGQKPVQDEPDKGIRPDEVLKEHLRDRNSTRREYASPVNEKE